VYLGNACLRACRGQERGTHGALTERHLAEALCLGYGLT
jgi:hypothetical protein